MLAKLLSNTILGQLANAALVSKTVLLGTQFLMTYAAFAIFQKNRLSLGRQICQTHELEGEIIVF